MNFITALLYSRQERGQRETAAYVYMRRLRRGLKTRLGQARGCIRDTYMQGSPATLRRWTTTSDVQGRTWEFLPFKSLTHYWHITTLHYESSTFVATSYHSCSRRAPWGPYFTGSVTPCKGVKKMWRNGEDGFIPAALFRLP